MSGSVLGQNSKTPEGKDAALHANLSGKCFCAAGASSISPFLNCAFMAFCGFCQKHGNTKTTADTLVAMFTQLRGHKRQQITNSTVKKTQPLFTPFWTTSLGLMREGVTVKHLMLWSQNLCSNYIVRTQVSQQLSCILFTFNVGSRAVTKPAFLQCLWVSDF